MKKPAIAAIIVGTSICIFTGTAILINFYNVKDYKSTLARRNNPEGRVTNSPVSAGQAVDIVNASSTPEPSTPDVSPNTPSPEPSDSPPVEKDSLLERSFINILFLGIDRDEERDSTMGVFRTDTLSLVVIDLDAKKVEVLCIPRDTYTFVPVENKKDKINHAYAFGSLKKRGVESSIDAVNYFIKYSQVDYYLCIDMEPVPEIVDDIGGVELEVDISIRSGRDSLHKGLQLLNGRQALKYIRWRSSGNGDIDRIKRQQKLLKAIFKKLKDNNKLLYGAKLVLGYNKNVKTDLSLKQLVSLAALASEIPAADINYHIVPGEAKIINKIWYWVPEDSKTDSLLKRLFVR